MKDVVPHRGKTRRPEHGDFSRIPARQEEVVAIEVDELHANALKDGPDIGIPLGEDMITMFHQASVLDIGAGLPSQTPGTLEKNHPPAAERQLTGNDHAGETSADDDGRRISHVPKPFLFKYYHSCPQL